MRTTAPLSLLGLALLAGIVTATAANHAAAPVHATAPTVAPAPMTHIWADMIPAECEDDPILCQPAPQPPPKN